MIPTSFDYHKASSVDEAIRLLDQGDGDAKILAGGHSLLPVMKLRLNSPEKLIDIAKLAELKTIAEDGGDIVIGAACTHDAIASSAIIQAKAPIMAEAAAMIGDIQVRNVGTIGGSIAHADPAADWPAVILAADGIIEIQGPEGKRKVAASDFFQGLFTTDLAENEIITAVRIPIKNALSAYQKFVQPASRFAIVGCAAVIEMDGDVCTSASVAFSGITGRPMRDAGVEGALFGQPLNEASIEAAAQKAAEGIDLMSDHFASEKYRRHLAKVYAKRALMAAMENGANDDLTKVEGIGPKIAELLNAAGIHSYAKLSKTSAAQISSILSAAGASFARHNPGTWPEQARLAAAGEWDKLKAWQDELDGGV